MLSLNPESMTERDNYKFLTGSIIPRPVALVTSVSKDGTINAAPFSYFNIVSSNPPMISLSIQRKNGSQKDTARNACLTGEFVAHIIDEELVEEANKTAAQLPPDQSELSISGLSAVQSDRISVPGIMEAKIRFECKLERHIELPGEDGSVSCDFLIGKVVKYHISEGLYKEGRIDPLLLKPVSRLAGQSYSKLGQLFELERPK
ncbi:flavin reductase family protein [Peribacillus sp. SCS-155]|uniref:flavin reductase family protein n=1 Tax=Peribacillus sedimenti TaxID=3115297 RepID=UPI003906D05F